MVSNDVMAMTWHKMVMWLDDALDWLDDVEQRTPNATAPCCLTMKIDLLVGGVVAVAEALGLKNQA